MVERSQGLLAPLVSVNLNKNVPCPAGFRAASAQVESSLGRAVRSTARHYGGRAAAGGSPVDLIDGDNNHDNNQAYIASYCARWCNTAVPPPDVLPQFVPPQPDQQSSGLASTRGDAPARIAAIGSSPRASSFPPCHGLRKPSARPDTYSYSQEPSARFQPCSDQAQSWTAEQEVGD